MFILFSFKWNKGEKKKTTKNSGLECPFYYNSSFGFVINLQGYYRSGTKLHRTLQPALFWLLNLFLSWAWKDQAGSKIDSQCLSYTNLEACLYTTEAAAYTTEQQLKLSGRSFPTVHDTKLLFSSPELYLHKSASCSASSTLLIEELEHHLTPFPSTADRAAAFLRHREVACYSNSCSTFPVISVEDVNE